MRLSVVIPTLNAAASLGTTLAKDAQTDGQLGRYARKAAGWVLGWHVSPLRELRDWPMSLVQC